MTFSMTQIQTQSTQLPSDCQDTPLSDDALALFPQFSDRIRLRLQIGKATYGDKSFTMPMARLADEICQELLDVAGWSFIQYARIQRLIQDMKSLDGGQEAVNLAQASDCPSPQAPSGHEFHSPSCGQDS